MPKTFKYRLYPNQEQEKQLEKTLETCRILYNDFLAERRDNEKKRKGKLLALSKLIPYQPKKKTTLFLKKFIPKFSKI